MYRPSTPSSLCSTPTTLSSTPNTLCSAPSSLCSALGPLCSTPRGIIKTRGYVIHPLPSGRWWQVVVGEGPTGATDRNDRQWTGTLEQLLHEKWTIVNSLPLYIMRGHSHLRRVAGVVPSRVGVVPRVVGVVPRVHGLPCGFVPSLELERGLPVRPNERPSRRGRPPHLHYTPIHAS